MFAIVRPSRHRVPVLRLIPPRRHASRLLTVRDQPNEPILLLRQRTTVESTDVVYDEAALLSVAS